MSAIQELTNIASHADPRLFGLFIIFNTQFFSVKLMRYFLCLLSEILYKQARAGRVWMGLEGPERRWKGREIRNWLRVNWPPLSLLSSLISFRFPFFASSSRNKCNTWLCVHKYSDNWFIRGFLILSVSSAFYCISAKGGGNAQAKKLGVRRSSCI